MTPCTPTRPLLAGAIVIGLLAIIAVASARRDNQAEQTAAAPVAAAANR